MFARVLRRNRRTPSPKQTPLAYRIILLVSFTVCIGGFMNVTGAVAANRAADGQAGPAEQTQASTSSAQPNPYNGIIAPSQQSSVAVHSSSTASSSPPPAQTSTASEAAEPAAQGTSQTDSTYDATQDAPQEQADQARGYTVIHHSAYREIPHYIIVHHQASTAQEVSVNGVTHVEWTRCPVCGARHESAFNEQIVDYVTPCPCPACGGKHESDYDETIWY